MPMLSAAVDANTALEALATEMGKAGVDDETIGVVNQMSEVTNQLVKALGEGAEGQPPQDPVAAEAEEEAAVAEEEPGLPPEAGAGGPQGAATIGEATDQMIAEQAAAS